MTYDYKAKKIVAVIAENLESWQSMNVVGHMATALGANKDSDLMGRSVLKDASGISHIGIARVGFIIKKGNSADIASLIREARKDISIITVDFPKEMLDTRHDDDLADSMARAYENTFEYLGVLIYGPSIQIDALTKNFKLWR